MSRAQFVSFWTLAQTWPVAVATIWLIVHVGDNSWEMDVQAKLMQYSMLLAALTQWPLLFRRVRFAWLWVAAGLAISLISIFLDDVLRHTDYGRQLIKSGPLSSYSFRFGCGSLSVGLCQAAAVGIWRKGAVSWLVFSSIAFLIASVAGLYAAAYFGPWFLGSLDNWNYMLATRAINFIIIPVIFGISSGWLMARRLIANSGNSGTVPA